MKQFTIIKVGYSAGAYGCSGEYFTCVYVNKNGINSFKFYGMYGVEERIANSLKKLGYKEKYTRSDYGQMKIREVDKQVFLSERKVIDMDENLSITLQ